MATKYSDLIQLQDFLPVYDILETDSNSWKQFIPTDQFCNLLNSTITCFTSKEISKRKSIWVRGTFGTGKSHASSVVKHLLCDDIEKIDSYINNISNVQLRAQIRTLRNQKRFFSVTLKGVENAYDIPHFSLAIRRETQNAIAKIDPEFVVNSDYQTAIKWIESHRPTFESAVLTKDKDLYNVVDNTEQVLERLKVCDSEMYSLVEQALTRKIGPVLQHSNISEWLVEVEQALEKKNIADALVIFWDEFTSVMDTLKSDRINVLQNIAEKSQNNNVFLFLISHRTESQSYDLRNKDITKMSDRFADIEYSMDTISTYLIMRHSLSIDDASKPEYDRLHREAFAKLNPVIQFLCEYNKEEQKRIEKLFPLHPFTAYLCSTLSNHLGSSNRSVIRFMHDEDTGFGKFLNNDLYFQENKLLTADSLWDFFLTEFDKDPACTAFTSIYNSYIDKVESNGDDYARVFKSILLLNALAPKFGRGNATTEKLLPNRTVIGHIFEGDPLIKKLNIILDYLHDNNIVSRNIFDEYKISASNFNQGALNKEKEKQQAVYKTATDILEYNLSSVNTIDSLFRVGETVKRPTVVRRFACELSESQIKSYLNKFTSEMPNYVHVALFMSISEDERDSKINLLKSLSIDYENTAIVLLEESFTRDYYTKFIDAIATQTLANQQFNKAEAAEYGKHAHKFVEKWIDKALSGNYTIYFNGGTISEGAFSQINNVFNKKIAPSIFKLGFEKVKKYQDTAYTFFNDKNCPTVILQILEATNRDQITKHGGSASPISHIFEDNGNLLLKQDGSLSEYALSSDAWIIDVCNLMDKCMEEAKNKYHDRFNLGDILAPFMQEPYGFYASFANCAALAYALRKHKQDLFLPGISQPVTDDKLSEFLKDICKNWKDGKADKNSNNKLSLRFGSPEESKLTEILVDIFDLRKIKGGSEIKSLENAKWYIAEFCKQIAHQPLWALKYANIGEDLKEAVNRLISLLGVSVPSIGDIKETYKILSLNRTELNIELTKPSNYELGFEKFVDSIEEEEPETKRALWDEMIEDLNTLQDEIAVRKEELVRQKIVAFFNRKLKEKINAQNIETTQPQPQSQPHIGTPSTDSVKNAKDKIKRANMPNIFWQSLVTESIDKYPDVADFWNKSLS